MAVAKRLLMITPDVTFAKNAKKALERDGKFKVTPFASGVAGVDYLRQHPQDVAFVDFRTKDMPGTDMIDHFRTLQPAIAVIAAPEHPRISELADKYNIQGIISIPISARKLVSLLNSAIDYMSRTAKPRSRPKRDSKQTRQTARALEFWLSDSEDGETIIEFKPPTDTDSDVPAGSSITFQQLAAEEPPMPDLASGGTIRDMRDKLATISDTTDKRRVVTRVEPVQIDDADTQPDDTPKAPAAWILDATLDESSPLQVFSLDGFMKQVAERNVEGISALPSWKEEDERFIRPPTFLPPELQLPELEESIEYTGTVTLANIMIESDPGDLVTDPIEPIRRTFPAGERPPSIPEMPSAQEAQTSDAETLSDAEAAQHKKELQPTRPTPPPPPPLPDIAVSDDTQADEPYTRFIEDDPAITQLATELTQLSLESRTDATVLVRDGEIVGYAGRIPQEMIEPLYDQLTREWDLAEETNKSRVVFALVPETGDDYMISTTRTNAGFTLSLIFSGTRAWQDIRRQSQRIVDVLEAMPEPELPEISQPFQPIIDESIARTPIAYVWLLADPTISLDETLQRPVRKSLQRTLYDAGWVVDDIVIEDYIYIYGQMPKSLSARDVLPSLLEASADAIKQDAANVWDKSYLILQPGRPMEIEEIQRFINFARR
ncbi:MAG: response regulator [Chloroflexota bacterium]